MSTEGEHWFALKIFYSRTMKLKAELEAAGVTTYVAMTTVERARRGKKVLEPKPLIPSLLFLRCDEAFLRGFKWQHNSEFMYYEDLATRRPAPIDEVQMRSFIILTSADRGTRVQYLGESVPDFKRGERVRVTGGLYEGAEGYIKKVRSDRKLIVEIRGVAVVAVSYIEPQYLEKL